MNPVARGIKNAFRNGARTAAIVIILGLTIGLGLTMLVAEHAVNSKIDSVKSSIGNTIAIAPAGFSAGSSANNTLTSDQLAKVKSLAHVTSLDESLSDRLPTTGSSQPSFGRFGGDSSTSGSTTSLKSPTTLNFNRPGSSSERGGFFFNGGNSSNSLPTSFSLPVSFLGTTNPTSPDGNAITILSGQVVDGGRSAKNALISGKMASKNSLKIGSTFTAYDTKLTVAGIFSSSNQSTQGTVVLPLATLQKLSGQGNNITSAVATVDSLDNLDSVTSAIKNTLGAGNADVTSAEDQANNTLAPLNSVKSVAAFSLIGAVTAGAIIILFLMIIIVRERKKEIGIVKAVGGSNFRIASEFAIEALTLTIAGAIIGLVLGVIAGQPVTNKLVSSNSDSTTSSTTVAQRSPTGGSFDGSFQRGSGAAPAGDRRGGGFGRNFRNNGAIKGLSNIKTEIGWGILLDGLAAALIIAIVGSLIATSLIVRVRPSTIMRNE